MLRALLNMKKAAVAMMGRDTCSEYSTVEYDLVIRN
jgi:hypothetical protein